MAVVTFIANSSPVAVATSAAPGYPAGFAANDGLIYFLSTNSTSTLTPPDGWVQLGSVATTGTMRSWAFFKRAVGDETGTVTTATPGGTKGVAFMTAYRSETVGAPAVVGIAASGLDVDATSTVFTASAGSLTFRQNDRVVAYAVSEAPTGTYTASLAGPTIDIDGRTLGAGSSRIGGRTGTNTLVYNQTYRDVLDAGVGTPVYTATAQGANGRGVVLFLVVREQAPVRSGAASTASTNTIVAAGRAVRRGTSATASSTAITASGVSPKRGAANTSTSTSVSASGSSARAGQASSVSTTSIIVAGSRTASGSGQTATAGTVAAAGRRANSGQAQTVTSTTGTSAGVRHPKGASSTTTANQVTATGQAVQVGRNSGSAQLVTATTAAATGSRKPKGQATATSLTLATANGATARNGSATTQTIWTANAAGYTLNIGTAATQTLTTISATATSAERHNITVTATLGPRTTTATLNHRGTTATLKPRAWEGTL